MALISCPECKKQISDTAANCPKCGYQLSPEKIAEIQEKALKDQKKQQGCLITGIAILAILLGIFLSHLLKVSSGNIHNTDTDNITLGDTIGEGMTWDEALPILQTGKRLYHDQETVDQFTDLYMFPDHPRGYSITFERPSLPDSGPYRITRIRRIEK